MNDFRIYFDLDGVEANFIYGAAKVFGRDYDDLIANWPLGEYDMPTKVLGITENEFFAEIEKHGAFFWADLPPYDHTLPLWESCKAIAPTYILTKPTYDPACVNGKVQWMHKMFGRKFRDYVLTPKKRLCANGNSILIDDSEVNIKHFCDAGGIGILFPSVSNKEYKNRDKAAEFVLETVKEIYGSRSNLPLHVIDGYWGEVRRLLQSQYLLDKTAATNAIKSYRAALSSDGVKDEVYHAPVDETARGIVEGGY